MPKANEVLQLAVVGAGAISDAYYFPALARSSRLRGGTWVIDPSPARRAYAIDKFGFNPVLQAADIADLPRDVTAVINATPSHLHLATTMPLVERGVNVLVEKPFAEHADDARLLVDAARGRSLLAVNQFRRLRAVSQFVHDYIRRGDLGRVRRISWSEGHKFDWPTQSGFYFRRPWREGRPRGVLLDIGVHVLDLICWWLGETPTAISAEMDGHGGPEGHVAASLAAAEAEIEVELSFHAKMSNRFLIEFERGTMRCSALDTHFVEIEANGRARKTIIGGSHDWNWIATRTVENFVAAIEGREKPLIPADSVLAPLQVVDQLYDIAAETLADCYREWVA